MMTEGANEIGSSASSPRIDLRPDKALIDGKVSLRLLGLGPNQPVTMRAWTQDDLGKQWKSHATFQADDDGIVDVSSQKPLSGTYADTDATGLFWSMQLDPDEKEAALFTKTGLTPTVMTFTAEVEGKSVASATLERLFVASDVIRQPVRAEGLVGTFFRPAHLGQYPGVIVVGGSGGGLDECPAALLASHGFATLALAYFAYEELPAELVNIPLEYFETAIHWLQVQDAVNDDKLAVMGRSRGGELALLIGATFPHIKAVIAYEPSGVMWGGFGRQSRGGSPAWLYQGIPLPFMRNRVTPAQRAELMKQEPIATTPLFLINLEDPAAVKEAAIPVEKINGAVLLISGQDDQMWPSSLMSEMVINRLTESHHPHPHQHLSYSGAGHAIWLPYLPATVTYLRHPVNDRVYALGGNAKSNAFASSDSWFRVRKFLRESLKA